MATNSTSNLPIKRLVLHCSDSAFGDVPTIDRWHREKKWNGIGYHYVIENGWGAGLKPQHWNASRDGAVARGRLEAQIGAHAEGWNTGSLGICLIGKGGIYTPKQLESLFVLLKALCARYALIENDLFGHYEIPSQKKLGAAAKKCPELAMPSIRAQLREELSK